MTIFGDDELTDKVLLTFEFDASWNMDIFYGEVLVVIHGDIFHFTLASTVKDNLHRDGNSCHHT